MLITLLSYYYGSMAVCIFISMLITLLLLVVWLCVYLFKCLLPYYLITVSCSNGCVYISLNAYYLVTLLLLYCSCVYICLNAYYLITLLPMVV